MTVRQINVQTGEETQRAYTDKELADIDAALKASQPSYADLRRAELHALDGEGMDAMRKAIVDLLAASNQQPSGELKAYLDKVNEVKAKYPKTV